MIKRIITILVLIIVLNILIVFNQKKEALPVFAEEDFRDNDYAIYNLIVDDVNITTRNINQYFQNMDIKILGIYPKINDLYQSKLSHKIGYYSFKKAVVNQNTVELELILKKMLKDYGFNGEIEKIEINGVEISKIKIYASKGDLRKLLKSYPKIKIE